MDPEATQQGADVQNPRNAALAQIAAQAHAQVSPDLQDFNEDTGEILQKQEQEAEPQHVQEEQHEPESPQTISITVDGQQLEVPMDKVLDAGRRTLQKESAADRRLQEATLLRQQWLERVNGSQEQMSPPAEGVTPHQQATPQGTPRLDIRGEIYAYDADKAVQRFKTEFSDIVSDQDMMAIVIQRENQRLAQAAALGDSLGDPWEAYRKHGEEVRKKFGKAPISVEDRTERKRNAVSVPSASARAPAPQPQRPKTTADIIADFRKARHQRVE